MITHYKVKYTGKTVQKFERKYGSIQPGQVFDMEIGDYLGLGGDPLWVRVIEPEKKPVVSVEETTDESSSEAPVVGKFRKKK